MPLVVNAGSRPGDLDGVQGGPQVNCVDWIYIVSNWLLLNFKKVHCSLYTDVNITGLSG